jgi:hypothetical protein
MAKHLETAVNELSVYDRNKRKAASTVKLPPPPRYSSARVTALQQVTQLSE